MKADVSYYYAIIFYILTRNFSVNKNVIVHA